MFLLLPPRYEHDTGEAGGDPDHQVDGVRRG
jgi:hypothetical protein